MLPDNIELVDPSTVDNLWKKGTDVSRDRLESFYLNLQYLQANKHPSGLVRYRDGSQYRLSAKSRRELWIYINLLGNNLRLLVSSLTSRTPQFMPIEHQADDYSISAGKLAKALLQDKYATVWKNLRQRALWYAYAGGACGIWVDWDEEKQTTVETLTTLTDMTFEPGAKDAETARWGIKQQLLPSAVVRAMYPRSFPDEPPSKDWSRSPYTAGVTEEWQYRADADVTSVKTLYVRPTSIHPTGGFFVTAGNKLVEGGAWPFPWTDRLNVAVLRQLPYEEVWWGGTAIDDCRSIQAYINQLWSYFLMGMRDIAAPILEVPGNMRSAVQNLDGAPGNKVFRQAGSTGNEGLRYVAPPAWQADVFNSLNLAKEALDDMTGIQDVLRGRNAPNVESGAGIVALQNAAMGDVNNVSRSESTVLGDVATMTVQLHAQRVLEPRIWLTKPSGLRAQRLWSGNDLRLVSTVQVPETSLDPSHKNFITQIVMQGLTSNVPGFDLGTLMKLEHIESFDQLLEETDPHTYYAMRENEWTATVDDMIRRAAESGDQDAVNQAMGLILPPEESDDHRKHIEQHNVFKSSGTYRRLHDLTKEAFDAHLGTHQKELMLEMENMMAMRQQAAAQEPVQQAA